MPKTGQGEHVPRGPVKPLRAREGVLSWWTLRAVRLVRNSNGRVVPEFAINVLELNNKVVKIQGFMMPLDPGEGQRHFLLSAAPPTCAFCVPASPEGLVEVRTSQPVRFTLEPVVIEGGLAVLQNDPYGVYYRISDGRAVSVGDR